MPFGMRGILVHDQLYGVLLGLPLAALLAHIG